MLAKAFKAMPSRTDVLVDLIVVSANAGQITTAKSWLDAYLVPRGDGRQVQTAERAIMQAERQAETNLYNQAVSAANRGDLDQAEQLLEHLLEFATQAPLIQSAKQRLEELRAFRAKNAAIDSVNEAIALANSGKHQDAVALIEEVLASDLDPQTEAEARRLLGEFKAATEKGTSDVIR